MAAQLLKMKPRAKPKTFTAGEQVIEYLSNRILADRRNYRQIAQDCDVSHSTISNIASRKTRWPRPKTFFSILNHYGIHLSLD